MRGLAEEAVTHAQLDSAAAVMAPLAPRHADLVATAATNVAGTEARHAFFDGKLPEDEGGLTLAQSINRSLADLLAVHPEVVVFGEDVAAKGGVYGVTTWPPAKSRCRARCSTRCSTNSRSSVSHSASGSAG